MITIATLVGDRCDSCAADGNVKVSVGAPQPGSGVVQTLSICLCTQCLGDLHALTKTFLPHSTAGKTNDE